MNNLKLRIETLKMKTRAVKAIYFGNPVAFNLDREGPLTIKNSTGALVAHCRFGVNPSPFNITGSDITKITETVASIMAKLDQKGVFK